MPWTMTGHNNVQGRLLCEARLSKGMTVVELAFRSGISLRTIERIESGDNPKPHYATRKVLAEALDMPIEVVFGEPIPNGERAA